MGETLERLRVVVRARVLKANGVASEYHRVMETFFGVTRIDRGVYGVEGVPGCVVSAVRVSGCIVGLESALYLHGLLPDEPWESWIYVSHKRWKPRPSAAFPIEVVRTRRRFDPEDIVKRPDGVAYTSIARTIVDFHRHRRRFLPGRPAEVLARALAAGLTTLDEVQRTAARLRVRVPLKSARMESRSHAQGDTPMARDVVIVGAARTPIGSFQGALSSLTAPQLGAAAIRAALERAGVTAVDQVVMGNVLQAGVGQAPARQAAIFAGLAHSTPCITVNKVCGSGLQAVVQAAQAIALGDAEVVVAGGMESMSNAPYLTHALRGGARMGHTEFKDEMILDGLWDPYDNIHMGSCAEQCADSMKISRSAQDEFAIESTKRAIKAQQDGAFKAEIAPVSIPQKKGDPVVVSEDEGPKNAKLDKIPTLKPVFKKDGTITAANASSINDGAAALVLMSADRAKAENRTVLGRITGHAAAARKPVEFTIAPADAINRLLTKAKLTTNDVDLWEINEAFAVVSIANNTLLKLDPSKVNVRGGAVVLGHPIGASGARVLVTLLQEMKDLGKKRGVASLCIGGGEGIALMVER